jgi:hypothetical protein
VLSRHTGTSTNICITVSRNPLSLEITDNAFVYRLVILRFLFQRILYFQHFRSRHKSALSPFLLYLSTSNRVDNGWTQYFSIYSILLQTMSREGRQYQSNEWTLNDVSKNTLGTCVGRRFARRASLQAGSFRWRRGFGVSYNQLFEVGWNWGRFFKENFGVSLSSNFPLTLHIHLTIPLSS